MQDIRLIALDLDGTVFDDEKKISPRTVAAIRAALAKGVQVLPATGRSASGVPEQFTAIPGVRYALTSNGASVVDLTNGERLVSLPFTPETAQLVYTIVAPLGGMISIFIGGECYTPCDNVTASLDMVPANLRPYFRDTRIAVPDMLQTIREHPHEVEKFSIMYRTLADRNVAWQALEARCPDMELTTSLERNLEINAPGVSKGAGLMALAQRLGLTAAQVMAVGDSDNDRTMIERAGLGVAMGNATDEIRAIANTVTADNNHDGVAVAIEKYVL